MSQSRLLPSWLPLRTCCNDGPWKLHEESAAFDRTDGRCYYCGKVADGLMNGRLPKRINDSYPWEKWFDGTAHVVHSTAKVDSFRRTAQHAARKRGWTVSVWRAGDEIHLQATRAA